MKLLDAAIFACLAAVAGWMTTACSAASDVEIKGNLELRLLSSRDLLLTGDYTSFIRERFRQEQGASLLKLDKQHSLKEWSRKFYYNYAATETIARYRPQISAAWQKKDGYKLTNEAGAAVPVEELGYWIAPSGQARFPDLGRGGGKLTQNADLLFYAFLRVAAPLRPGTYTLTNPLGEKVSFDYDPRKTPLELFKFNQMGYSPRARRKYAYAGAWRGDAGALPLKEFVGGEFFLNDADSGKRVFSGKISFRGEDSRRKGVPFTGEETLEFDFSPFSTPGRYRIAVPGLGVSREFAIAEEGTGEAFYIHARGLFHKRCGVEKSAPWTAWTQGACHTVTRQGTFPPEIKDYAGKANSSGGFYDGDGKKVGIERKQFELISDYNPEDRPLLPGVSGGWHDAADYDRRPQHFEAVNDLLAAWLMFPENFSDGQLNLPESGNKIPDIVDEAVHGMEVWRKAQKPDGGVGTWIEASSHPDEHQPALDRQPYYLSAATRNSSLDYAAHASMLALVFRELKEKEKSDLWTASARKAFEYAMNPAHRYEALLQARNRKNVRTLRYREGAELSPALIFKTAFNLWLLTGKADDLALIRQELPRISRSMGELSWALSPFKFVEFQLFGSRAPELEKLTARYRALIIRFADEALKQLDEEQIYRTPWHGADKAAVTRMSWGNALPLNRARYFIAAWKLTGDPKYRDAAFLANDFHNGANPTGTTLTSGLGRVYPVRFLDLPSYTATDREFVPGITPYRYTYRVSPGNTKYAFGLYVPPRLSHNFKGVSRSFLPEKWKKELSDSNRELSEKEAHELLSQHWPIWRRFGNVEAYSVAESEFTINETIAPAAAVTGCLMKPGWKPSEALKTKKPAADLKRLPGYSPLP